MGMTVNDATNVLYAQAEKVDNEVMSLLAQIEEDSRNLSDDGYSNEDKYKIIVGLEYLFARLRIVTETELIKVKKVLCDKDTPAVLKPFFQSRNTYLSEVSAKITLYREDIKVLDKSQYLMNSGYLRD